MIKTRLVRLLSHAKKYIVYNVLWQWVALIGQILAIFSVGRLLDFVSVGQMTSQIAVETFFVIAFAVCLRFLCDKMAAKASFAASVDVKRILREKIYEKLLRLGPSYSEKVNTSEVVQMSTEGVEQLETYFGKYLPQLFYSMLAPVTLFFVLSFVNFKASFILLLCVPLIPISIVAVQKIAKKLLGRYWSLYTELGDSFLENLQGMTTLKIYQADEKKAVEMDEEADQFRKITMKVLTMQLNSTSVMDLIAYGGAAVGMIVALLEMSKGNISFGGTLVLILLAAEFFLPLRLLGSFFHIAMNGMAASDKIFHLLDLEEEEKGSLDLPEDVGDITVRNLDFSYEPGRKILENVSIDLPKGAFVSLVGTSGCGKSTIASILMGKLKTRDESVLIGNLPLSSIKEESLMKQVTFVGHDSYLFKGTVEENLQMAKADATKKEMKQVLETVNLWGFLKEQQGLETKLLERGNNFSGGQRQRLAIARALLHDTPVYIFDEATSNIDLESEELIMDVIHQLAKTKTILFISHRLSNVTKSDCIYLLEQGKIKEKGCHQKLLDLDGSYAKLFLQQKQLEDYGKKLEKEKAV